MSRRHRKWNVRMAMCRISVECGLGRIGELFPCFTNDSNREVRKSGMGVRYLVAAFLTNCYNCLLNKGHSASKVTRLLSRVRRTRLGRPLVGLATSQGTSRHRMALYL